MEEIKNFIQVEVPKGKKAVFVNDVLTLVDLEKIYQYQVMSPDEELLPEIYTSEEEAIKKAAEIGGRKVKKLVGMEDQPGVLSPIPTAKSTAEEKEETEPKSSSLLDKISWPFVIGCIGALTFAGSILKLLITEGSTGWDIVKIIFLSLVGIGLIFTSFWLGDKKCAGQPRNRQ